MASIGNVENLQVVQGEHASAHQNNAPLVNKGLIENKQIYNFLQGVYVPDSLTKSYLSEFFNAVAREQWDVAHKAISPMIEPETFSHYENDRKKTIGSCYMNFCWVNGRDVELAEWYMSLQEDDQKIGELHAWNLLYQISKATEDPKRERKQLQGLVLTHDDNADIQAIGAIAGYVDIADAAIENITSWLGDESRLQDDNNYHPFMTLARYALEEEQYDLAERAVQALQKMELGVISSLNVSLYHEYIKIEQLLNKETFIQGLHIPIDTYKQLSASTAELEKIVKSARENNFDFMNAVHTLASVHAILFKPKKAIELFLSMDREKWHSGSIINLLNSYQMVGDYKAMIELIENLPEQQQHELSNYHALALVNVGEWERAEELKSEKLPEVEIFNPESRIPLSDIENFHYSSQIAVHRYREGTEEEQATSVEYLKSYSTTDNKSQLIQAESLLFCKQYKPAVDIFRGVFEETGAGYGTAFTNFMYALGHEQARTDLRYWYGKFDEGAPIEAYVPLKMAQLNFIHWTQSSKQLLPAIQTVLNNIDDKDALPFKTYWLQVHRQAKRSHTKYVERVRSWGNRPKGTLIEQLRYLTVLSNTMPSSVVLETWYELIHENPRNPEVLESFLFAIFNYLSTENELDWQEYAEVQDKSYVQFSDGSRVLIDNEYFETSRAPDLYSTEDEVASELLGKKVNDVVVFDGEEKTISEINTPYLWAYRYAQSELPRRRKSTAIRKLEIPKEDSERQFDNLYAELKSSAEAVKKLEGFVFNNHIPALTAMSYRGPALSGWLHLLVSEYESRISVTTSLDEPALQSISAMKHAVLDLSALSSLVFLTKEPTVVSSLWDEVAVVPSCAREVHYEKERNQTKATSVGTLSWDLDANAPVRHDHNDDLQKTWLELCDEVHNQIDQGNIQEIDSVPALELPEGDDRRVLQALEVSTKDSLLACYSYDDRFLVTDDPNLQIFAKRLGIVSVSTVQLMQYRMESGFISEDVFSKHFMNLGTGFVLPNETPVKVLNWIINQDYSSDYCDYMLNRVIPAPNTSIQNIRIILTLIETFLVRRKVKGAEYVLGYLLRKMTAEGEDIDTVLRILAHASEIPDKAVKDSVYSNIIRLSGTKTPVGYSITAALDYLLAKGRQRRTL